jgi:RimJ/RimL family protein N-acetyltransferase
MDWIELFADDRKILTRLFAACPGLRGCITAVLAGEMGAVFVDKPDDPKIAYMQAGAFAIFAGQPSRFYAEQKITGPLFIVSNRAWVDIFKQIHGDSLKSFQRVAFAVGAWKLDELRTLSQNIADGFVISRVSDDDVVPFAALDPDLVSNFADHATFLRKGIGFCVKYGSQIVAGCSSYLIGGGALEIEIITHPDFRRQGLSTAVAATMVEHCLLHDIEPCWDAANKPSVGLAKKLGFIQTKAYDTYYLEG